MATISSDPRFQLARALLSGQVNDNGSGGAREGGGPEAAIDIFATLLEIARQRDETGLDAALCQYEYGNALFRAVVRRKDMSEEEDDDQEGMDEKPSPRKDGQREMMAAAALKQSAAGGDPTAQCGKRVKIGDGFVDNEADLKKGDEVHSKNNVGEKLNGENGELAKIKNTSDVDESYEEDDVNLALEMMETSFAILLSHATNEDSSSKNEQKHQRQQWALGQLPRVLVCIGDLHSFCQRFGNAVDAYCRALPYRERAWKRLTQIHEENSDKTELLTLEGLQCQRHLVETYALVTEALLACPKGENVVCHSDNDDDNENGNHSAMAAEGSKGAKGSDEPKSIALVPAEERMNFARSHYEMAREGLKEIIYRMGKMAAAKMELGNEKEDIGYLVMMMVGIGNSIEHEK